MISLSGIGVGFVLCPDEPTIPVIYCVLRITNHDVSVISTLTKIYPGKRGFCLFLPVFSETTVFIGTKISSISFPSSSSLFSKRSLTFNS
jgi:hypothetical protein